MLTRKRSDRIRLAKYVTTLPVVLLLILFCTQTSLSGIKSGNNKVKFNGNEIEFGSFKIIPYEYREAMEQQKKLFSYTTLPDSVLIKDPLTGIQKWHVVKHDIMPVSINGQHIYGNEEQYMLNDNEKTYSLPVFNGVEKNIYEYLFNTLKDDFERLENGAYTLVIDRMVIDLNGKLAYYEPIGIRKWTSSGKSRITSSDVERSIDNKLKEALSQQIKFKPAVKDGKAVNVRTTLGNYDIIVKEHKATLVKIEGC